MTPRDGGLEGLMAERRCPVTSDEKMEAVVEALDDLIEAKRPQPDRREFDRQRDAVEATDKFDNGCGVLLRQFEGCARLSRTPDEQGDSLGSSERGAHRRRRVSRAGRPVSPSLLRRQEAVGSWRGSAAPAPPAKRRSRARRRHQEGARSCRGRSAGAWLRCNRSASTGATGSIIA